jgi:hypothetical protein
MEVADAFSPARGNEPTAAAAALRGGSGTSLNEPINAAVGSLYLHRLPRYATLPAGRNPECCVSPIWVHIGLFPDRFRLRANSAVSLDAGIA